MFDLPEQADRCFGEGPMTKVCMKKWLFLSGQYRKLEVGHSMSPYPSPCHVDTMIESED